jgi:hypothetical protein
VNTGKDRKTVSTRSGVAKRTWERPLVRSMAAGDARMSMPGSTQGMSGMS